MSENTQKPLINVISKEQFEKEVRTVFREIKDVLAKSYGPYGAPTIIYQHPISHVTKDGYTITKALHLNSADTYTPEAISQMVFDICGRLNTAVGDGTTTAIISTTCIYEQYLEHQDELMYGGYLPRDILYEMQCAKDQIRSKLTEEVVNVAGEDDMLEKISQVVYISSNADQTITNTIGGIYETLGFPAIVCEKAPDGEEDVNIIKGYRPFIYLGDETYVNNDNRTMQLQEANFVFFATKITSEIYESIIVPLLNASMAMGMKLVVVAPSYDEILLDRKISVSLQNMKRNLGDVYLVLTVGKMGTPYHRKCMSDFAMLCHTRVLTKAYIRDMLQAIEEGTPVQEFFTFKREWIPTDYTAGKANVATIGVNPAVIPYRTETVTISEEDIQQYMTTLATDPSTGAIQETHMYGENDNEICVNVGYARGLELGLKDTSIVHEFFYDEEEYIKFCESAKTELDNAVEKYKKLGTFNLETTQAQQRYYALRLSLAVIEIGGDSELSMSMRKDIYDDAVKAASSAFKYGVVKGCSVSTLRAIVSCLHDLRAMKSELPEKTYQLKKSILEFLFDGFAQTYKTVLCNWRNDEEVNHARGAETILSILKRINHPHPEDLKSDMQHAINKVSNDGCNPIGRKIFYDKGTLYDYVIAYSMESNQVFNLDTKTFDQNIINSYQTDDEILNATIDLMGLLISGNQMVVTAKNLY